MSIRTIVPATVLLVLCALGPVAGAKTSKALQQRLALLERLDAARAEALALIRDEARYTKDDDAAQREVNRLSLAVSEAYGPVNALLERDAKRLVRKRAALAALHDARPERLNAWERALRQRLADHEVERRNLEAVRALPRAERPTAHQVEQVRLTNAYRMEMGLPALLLDLRLAAAAASHSHEMRQLRYFDHTSPTDGRETPTQRAGLAGFAGEAVGENIAQGYRSPQAVHRGWLHSAGHHRNILDPLWDSLGVAADGDHWTQVFGRAGSPTS